MSPDAALVVAILIIGFVIWVFLKWSGPRLHR